MNSEKIKDTVDYIRRELTDAKPLNSREESALISIMVDDKRPRSLRTAAKTKLVRSHSRFMFAIACAYARRNGKPAGDLFQAAILGAYRAADSFDPSKGIKFLSYAAWWIRLMIQDEIYKSENAVRRPRWVKDGLTKEELMEVRPSIVSIYEPHGNNERNGTDERRTYLDEVEEHYLEIEEIFNRDEDEKLGTVIKSSLTCDQYDLLKSVYFHGEKQINIGARLGVSGERIRQRRNRYTSILKKRIEKMVEEKKFEYSNSSSDADVSTIFD